MGNNSRSILVAKNTGIMFIRMILLMGIGLYTSKEVLRILGISDYGIYNLIGTLVVMFSFLQTALNNATTRYITFDLGVGNENKLKKTFSMSLNSEILLALIIIILSEIFGPWFIENKLNIPTDRLHISHIVFQISLINLIINIIKTPYNSVVIAHEHFNFFAYISIIEGISKLVIVYMLTICSLDKLITYSILQVCITMIIFLIQIIYSYHHFSETHYKFYWDNKLLKNISKYSGYSLLVNIADLAVVQSINIFFNIFSGVVANAALGIANQVNTHINNFLGNFSQSYTPQIIKSYASNDNNYFMNLIFSTSKLSYFLYFGMSFPIMLNIDYILELWLHEIPQNTPLFLCLIIGYGIFDSFSQPLWCSVHATGNLRVHQILMSSIKILNIPISFILLKNNYPLYSVLIVYVILNFICSIVRIWWLSILIKLDTKKYYKEVILNLIKITFISIPVPIIISLLVTNECVSLISSCLMFGLIYTSSIYFLALNDSEIQIVNHLLKKIKLVITQIKSSK